LTKPHGLIAVIGANAARRRQAMRSLTKALAEYRPGSAVHALFEEGEAPIEAGIRNARVPREALADGLRLASRQDPDCIAVAPVTADLGELIMTLAMTGHLMLCELEGVTAVASLRAAGAPARHIAAALLGVVRIASDAARVDEVITIDEARREAIARGEAPGV
jgi:Tfp pilus assembly ATPase PilU